MSFENLYPFISLFSGSVKRYLLFMVMLQIRLPQGRTYWDCCSRLLQNGCRMFLSLSHQYQTTEQ